MLDLKPIHNKSIHHRQAVLESPLCGCFYCLRIYAPSEIKEWVARDDDQTAICPHCETDSVLPSTAVDLTPELLKAMQAHWFALPHFSSTVTVEEATAVKAILEQRLGRPAWLRSIEVQKDWHGLLFVKVNMVQEPEDVNTHPQIIDGVRVIFNDTGDAAPSLD